MVIHKNTNIEQTLQHYARKFSEKRMAGFDSGIKNIFIQIDASY